jgi:hypothetical protein
MNLLLKYFLDVEKRKEGGPYEKEHLSEGIGNNRILF